MKNKRQNIVAIIQARMTSTRLPRKVLMDICGKPSLQRMIERVGQVKKLDRVIVATTSNTSDDPIVELCKQLGVGIFRGDESDVLGRVLQAAEAESAEVVVRLTADCPMIDPDVINEVVTAFSINNHDYLSNTIDRTYPDGLDIEVMSIDTLREAHKKAVAPFLREHVTPYISGRRPDLGAGDFRVGQIRFVADFSHIRWTLDTKEDLQRIRSLVSKLPEDYNWLQALSIATREPDLLGNMIDGQTTEILSLRLAVASDVKLLFEWVNTPSSLKNKEKSSAPIEWSAHQNWFNKRLNNPNVRIWIVEQNKQAIGQVRVEYDNNKLLIDVFIDSLFRGNDYGLTALKLLIKQCQVTYPGVPLHAIIKNENYPSLNLFRRADFQEVSNDGHGHMSYFIYTNSNNIVERGSNTNRLFVRSNELYERALKTIPLASQTFSKSAMNFPRGASPLFLERGQGAYVWDYDGNKYVDYVLGLMPIILGYCDPDVDEAIKNQLNNGIIFSLPSDLEVQLSEKLIELIPCAEMVRFGKNGSDATSAAIRLARAHTGRDRIAVCGYHGWHDWYIGTTARNLGVPKSVQDLSSKFIFNDPDSLERLFKTDPIGFAAVILEPTGLCEPEDGFLERVRELCDQYGVVLVFDEIVTGFRVDMGGAQRKYGVTPDLATFGKAMANGMPISAIVGKREIMKLMDDIFFSGTFGGETLSLAAALATITKLEKINAPKVFERTGRTIRDAVQSIITDFELDDIVSVAGVDWWPRIVVGAYGKNSQIEMTTLLRQELIEQGIFMGGGFNLSIAHNDESVIAETLHGIHESFEKFSTYLKTDNPVSNLRGELIKPVFQVR